MEDVDSETGILRAQIQLHPPGVDHYGHQHCILAAHFQQCNTHTITYTHWHTNRMYIKFGFVSQAQIHLIGNPVSWCLANLGLLAYHLLAVVYLVRRRRGFKDLPDGIQTTHHTSLNLLDQRWLTCWTVRNVNQCERCWPVLTGLRSGRFSLRAPVQRKHGRCFGSRGK